MSSASEPNNQPASKMPSTDAEKGPGGSPPLLQEVIERIGFGYAQVKAVCLGGGVYLADGSEILLISTVADAVAVDWNMTIFQRGMVVTMVFIGILIGNLGSGIWSDRYGRQQMIFWSYVGIFIFSIASSLTWSFLSLSAMRLMVGLSFGLGQPAWNAMGAEITPCDYRIVVQTVAQGFFVLGEVFSCILLITDDPTLKHLHWRLLLQLGSIPAAIFAVGSWLSLKETPAFLSLNGRYDDAKDVLKSMRDDNNVGDMPVDFRLARSVEQLPHRHRQNARRHSQTSRRDVMRQLRIIFSPTLCTTTFIVMYTCFVLNFSYYGSMYAFPQVLPNYGTMQDSAGIDLLIGALWELPGQLLGVVTGLTMYRKSNLKFYLSTASISMTAFCVGMTTDTNLSPVAAKLGYYGIKCFVDMGFITVYQYAIEIYPTSARATGSGVAIGCGRLAGIISPLVFEYIQWSFGWEFFYYLLTFLAILNYVLIDFLPFETFGMMLKDEAESESSQSSESEDSPRKRSPESSAALGIDADSQGGKACRGEEGEARPLLPGQVEDDVMVLPEPLKGK